MFATVFSHTLCVSSYRQQHLLTTTGEWDEKSVRKTQQNVDEIGENTWKQMAIKGAFSKIKKKAKNKFQREKTLSKIEWNRMSEKEREKKTSICLFFTVAVTVANCIRWVFVFGSVAATGNSISLNVFLWKHFAKKAEKTNEKKNGGNGKVYHRKYSSFWLFQNGRIESCRVRNTKKYSTDRMRFLFFYFRLAIFMCRTPEKCRMKNKWVNLTRWSQSLNSFVSLLAFLPFVSSRFIARKKNDRIASFHFYFC